MLGRYVGGTLLILGLAMLMAPDSPDREIAADAASDPSPRAETAPEAGPATAGAADKTPAPVPAEPAAEEGAASLATFEVARDTRLVAAPASGPAEGRASAEAEERARSISDLADRVAASVAAPPVPTLEDPASLSRPRITQETMALIERTDAGVVAPASAAAGDAERDRFLYVTGTRVNVRSGPSTDYAVIGSLPYGEEVELVSNASESWAEIRLPDARVGYMSRNFLAADPG